MLRIGGPSVSLAAGCPHALKVNDGEAVCSPRCRGGVNRSGRCEYAGCRNTSASMELAQSCLKTDGNDTPDIESILTFIRSLKSRRAYW